MLYNPNTASELLRRAADIIETDGLARRHFHNDDGYCTQGALMRAMGASDAELRTIRAGAHDHFGPIAAAHAHDGYNAAMTALYDLIITSGVQSFGYQERETLAGRRNVVASWNNYVAKDKAEVVSTLRKASELVEAF